MTSKNVTNKTDQELHSNLITLVKQERELVINILNLLKEVQLRHLYSDFKCASLWEYTTKVLGYSSTEAYNRIAAMWLLLDVPKAEKAIKTGELSLSNAAQAQSFFRKESRATQKKISKTEKATVVQSLVGRSTREAKKILTDKSLQPHIHRESIRAVADDRLEFKFSIDRKIQEKLTRLKNRLAHKNIPTQEALFDQLLDLALKQTEITPPKPSALKKAHKSLVAQKIQKRHIPSAVRKLVMVRDQETCTKCGSQYALQLDHRQPYRNQGAHTPENLQVLCRSCNLRKEIKVKGGREGPKKLI